MTAKCVNIRGQGCGLPAYKAKVCAGFARTKNRLSPSCLRVARGWPSAIRGQHASPHGIFAGMYTLPVPPGCFMNYQRSRVYSQPAAVQCLRALAAAHNHEQCMMHAQFETRHSNW